MRSQVTNQLQPSVDCLLAHSANVFEQAMVRPVVLAQKKYAGPWYVSRPNLFCL